MLSVSQYQRNLRHYYYYYRGNIDGIKGAQTTSAVKNFQREHRLTVDGIYGVNTNAKLVDVIKAMQKKLGVAADGIVGINTINAIIAFQKKKGLKADGIAGAATFAKLNGSSNSSGSSSHFAKSEFKCGCKGRYCNGYPAGSMDARLLNLLEKLRSYYGKPIIITSGQRCTVYNKSVGGVSNSAHKYGKAADFYISGICDTASGRNQVVSLAYKFGASYAYCNTSGMGNAVHVNV